jgi:hypothetical protein
VSYSGPALSGDALRDAFLAEVKKTKAKFVYNTLIASARRVEAADRVITFVFGMRPSTLQGQFEAQRASLEEIATTLAGRPMKIATVEEKDAAPSGSGGSGARANMSSGDQDKLKAAVMQEPAVQAMLDVFPAEIKDVEEM